jgi:hypothetical protein
MIKTENWGIYLLDESDLRHSTQPSIAVHSDLSFHFDLNLKPLKQKKM